MTKDIKRSKALGIIGKVALSIFTVLAAVLIALLLIINTIVNGKSKTARQLFVSTMLETGQLKFLVSMFLDSDEIQKIVDENSMKELNEKINTDLILVKNVSAEAKASRNEAYDEYGFKYKDGISVVGVSGRTFYGTLMIIRDPSRITVESYYNDYKKGAPIDEIVEEYNGIAGINGGLYNSGIEAGGQPYGVVVSHGEIQRNKPKEYKGLVMIGFNNDNILVIEDIKNMSESDFESYVKTAGIRDAVCFQEESSDKNNHFVQLLVNGVQRELNGMGSGLNPRTAIGQRADGAVLLLVTDGRGSAAHLGASAADLISVMSEYHAVNAANLDGGSSSCMYYDGAYLMDSVTFRKANTSWNLPLAFVVGK